MLMAHEHARPGGSESRRHLRLWITPACGKPSASIACRASRQWSPRLPAVVPAPPGS